MWKIIDQEAFDAVECNRCGHCCEQIVLPDREHCLGHLAAGGKSFDRVWLDQLTYVGPCEQEMTDEEVFGKRLLFKCSHLRHEEDGTTTCVIYAERPMICRDFPYGHPVDHYPGCVWLPEELAKRGIVQWEDDDEHTS
jgi:Fe-S-cluster containining protein